MRFVVFGFLFIGFYLLFGELRTLEYLSGWLKRTRSGINEAARQRSLADRQRLLTLQEKHSRWHAVTVGFAVTIRSSRRSGGSWEI